MTPEQTGRWRESTGSARLSVMDAEGEERPQTPSIRDAVTQDGTALLSLWHEAETEPGHTDDLQSIDQLIRYDPGAVIVADLDGRIVGSVIAGWDGWRGSIYRLAVAPLYRRQGLGRKLVRAAESRLAALGAVRLQAIVVENDVRATSFWRSTDWAEQTERLRFVKR